VTILLFSSVETIRMSLKLSELHELYASVSREDAVAMANLGAVCWSSFKDGLYSQWATTMTSEEAEKAAVYKEEGRKEGREATLESLKVRVVAGEVAIARVAALEASIAEEVERKIGEMLTLQKQQDKLIHLKELEVLKIQLAELKGKGDMFNMLKEAHEDMKRTIASQTSDLAKYKEATSTKSSYALGKIGESTIQQLIEERVIPRYPNARLENVATTSHSADFHLYAMSHLGKMVKLLIDVKNYKEQIRTKEMTKLYADMDADSAAIGGMLISLDSCISGLPHFYIKKTPEGKPCLHLMLKDMTDDIRGDILLWASLALVGLTPDGVVAKQDTLHADVSRFLADLSASAKDADLTVKACNKASEAARNGRDRLIRRITDFKIGSFVGDTLPPVESDNDEEGNTISHVSSPVKSKKAETEKEPSVIPDINRCTFVKEKGGRCRNRRMGSLELCKSHS